MAYPYLWAAGSVGRDLIEQVDVHRFVANKEFSTVGAQEQAFRLALADILADVSPDVRQFYELSLYVSNANLRTGPHNYSLTMNSRPGFADIHIETLSELGLENAHRVLSEGRSEFTFWHLSPRGPHTVEPSAAQSIAGWVLWGRRDHVWRDLVPEDAHLEAIRVLSEIAERDENVRSLMNDALEAMSDRSIYLALTFELMRCGPDGARIRGRGEAIDLLPTLQADFWMLTHFQRNFSYTKVLDYFASNGRLSGEMVAVLERAGLPHHAVALQSMRDELPEEVFASDAIAARLRDDPGLTDAFQRILVDELYMPLLSEIEDGPLPDAGFLPFDSATIAEVDLVINHQVEAALRRSADLLLPTQ